jgi:hypothetical protein
MTRMLLTVFAGAALLLAAAALYAVISYSVTHRISANVGLPAFP